jgi:hypothetical protein
MAERLTKSKSLAQSQVDMLRLAGQTVLHQLDGVRSDDVLEIFEEAGFGKVDAMEAMLNIHPLTLPPQETNSRQKYKKVK